MRRIAILDAPSNLGLRPPTTTSVPGCAKAPGALRDHGLIARLHARDAGCLTPPRYDPGDWRPGDGVAHAGEIAAYSRKLADRIGGIIDAGEFPVILGGDCSIVLGSGLAMHRLGEAVGGRIGLVFVDGHSDFRHPGNASYVGAAAGEDLALVTGRGQADLAAIEGRRPYFRDVDVVVMGIRAQDEYRLDLQAAGIITRPVPTLRVEGAARSAQWARDQLVDCAGYWVHVDMDVLDPAVMPAVDAPEPGGIAFPELELLLAGLVDTPHCLGVEITVFDPDYDPDGAYAEEIASALVAGLAPVRTVAARPDLIAARRDLAARTDGPAFALGRLAPPEPAAEDEPAAAEQPANEPTVDELAVDELAVDDADQEVDSPVPGTAATGGLRPDALGLDALGLGGLRPGGLRPGGLRPGGLRPGGLAPGRLASASGDVPGGDEPDADDSAARPDRFALPDRFAERRAAAARESVTLAAAAMSDGGAPDLDEAALPAGTLISVEEADEVESRPAATVDPDDDEGPDDEGPSGGGSDEPADPDPATEDEDTGDGGVRAEAFARVDGVAAQAVTRPLGSAPLLDSQPLPATRPGMLRPRTADGFSLPAQRPAFDVGPADIA